MEHEWMEHEQDVNISTRYIRRELSELMKHLKITIDAEVEEIPKTHKFNYS